MCEPYLWEQNKPTFNSAYLELLETEHSINFPIQFIEFFEENFGDKPQANIFKFSEKQNSIAHFLHCQRIVEQELEIYSISEQKEDLDEFVSPRLVPFAITFDSNLLVLDFRESSSNPSISFVISSQIEDGDLALRHVSYSFQEFIENLEC